MSLTTQTPPPSEIGTALVGQRQRHWLGLPVRPATEGTFDDVLRALPHFGRQPFAMASLNGDELGINSYLDIVYRLPIRQGERPVPVGELPTSRLPVTRAQSLKWQGTRHSR
jgi:hypothetical protein